MESEIIHYLNGGRNYNYCWRSNGRGLPAENLNSSREDRSNIRWDTGANNPGFYGDDFTIGTTGETYAIDKIRTWIVPGLSIGDPANLGDWFESITLFVGDGPDVSPVVTTDNFTTAAT